MSTTTPLTLTELQARCYSQAADKGFHDYRPENDRADLSYLMEKLTLIHGEVSEAAEELRKGHPVDLNYYPADANDTTAPLYREPGTGGGGKPEGFPAELADVLIRILDLAGARDIDIEAAVIEKLDYNATRSRMHGGRKA